MSFNYLASPYSHPIKSIQLERFHKAEHATQWFLKQHICVFSPIIHCHALAEKYEMPTDVEFWQEYNFKMLEAAEALWVLVIDGARTSKGISIEMTQAARLAKPIFLVFPRDEGYKVISSLEELLRDDPQNPKP